MRFWIVVLAMALCACAHPVSSTAAPGEVEVEIRQLRQGFVAAYGRADAPAVAAFYAPDATYIGTAGDVVTGRDTILRGLSREVPFFRDFRIEPAEFGVSNQLAYERGTWRTTLTVPDRPAEAIGGPYVVVYERDLAGGWHIKQHMAGRRR